MNRLVRPLGLVAALALVGYAGVLVLADPDADDVVDDAIAKGQTQEGEREAVEQSRERLRRTARGLAMSPEGRLDGGHDPADRSSEPSAVPYGSGEVDPINAREGFSYAMSRVDEIVKDRRRLSQDEWDALYRETNDAFSALSMVVDPYDDQQMAELEAAHQRLLSSLRKVRVDGRKLAD